MLSLESAIQKINQFTPKQQEEVIKFIEFIDFKDKQQAMNSLKNLINRHKHEFPDFEYYNFFAEFINAIETYHQDLNTGISLDSCNSLLQSICKTIITDIDSSVEIKDLNKGSSSTTNSLVSKAAKLLQKNDDNSEFNDYLDGMYPCEGKVLYSRALYKLYYGDYEIKLQDFLDEQELLEESD